MSKQLIEVFTSGCFVCDKTVKQVKDLTQYSAEHEVVIHDLNKKCETNECEDKAKEYGVEVVPSVAVNGKLLDCCKNTGIDFKTLEREILGQ